MTASRADAEAKIDAAILELEGSTSGASGFVAKYGPDPAQWPVETHDSHWYKGLMGLLAARTEVADLVDPAPAPTPTPPPPTPTPTGTVWESDATKATLDPDSAAKVKAAIGSTPGQGYFGPLGYFFIEVAHDLVTSHDLSVAYKVDTTGKPGALDAEIWLMFGQGGGISNDQHIWIEDLVTKRWHDLDGVSFDSNGKLASWRFGSSMDAGSVQVPRVANKSNQGATAAMFPLERGTVTPEEVVSGVIPHALCFVAANLGPAPNPYPANSLVGYTTGNDGTWAGKSVTGHIPLGTWMRMDPAATIVSSASKFEKMIFTCLQQHGMFCRDRGSSLSLHGQDRNGKGSSIQAWRDAGVPLGDGTSGTSKGLLRLSNIPWERLQVCVPPARP